MRPTLTGNSTPDAELARRSRQGDALAFAELVRKYQDRVYNTCYRMCHNHADAADLTQAAFLKAYRAINRFEARSSFYTWIFRIAANVVLSDRRSRSRQRVSIVGDGAGDGQECATGHHRGPPEFASDLERREFKDRVASALGTLEEEFRIVLILKDVEEMDYAAISEILDLPLGTVKSRLHRGRLLLREMLRDVVD